MYFAPFIVRAEHERKVPVVIERATAEDLKATAKVPKWQTDWTSEYLADEKIEKYYNVHIKVDLPNKKISGENLEIYENINFQQAHIYEYIKDFLKRKNEDKFYLTLEVLGKYLMHYNTELQSKIFKIYFCYTQNEKNAAEHLKRVFSISSNSVSPISSFSNACVCLLKNPDNDVFDFCFLKQMLLLCFCKRFANH